MAVLRLAALSAHEVDLHRARAVRLARLAQRLNLEGHDDDAVAVLDAALAARRLADESVRAWSEAPRTAVRRAS